jgi:DNA-binding LacI/PurR family transcriptional regulator
MPKKEEVTLKDIAEAVGKSVAAVSRALNNHMTSARKHGAH